jgi:hypothetical protein
MTERQAGRMIPKHEREVLALGRSFGAHSVEVKERGDGAGAEEE